GVAIFLAYARIIAHDKPRRRIRRLEPARTTDHGPPFPERKSICRRRDGGNRGSAELFGGTGNASDFGAEGTRGPRGRRSRIHLSPDRSQRHRAARSAHPYAPDILRRI